MDLSILLLSRKFSLHLLHLEDLIHDELLRVNKVLLCLGDHPRDQLSRLRILILHLYFHVLLRIDVFLKLDLHHFKIETVLGFPG